MANKVFPTVDLSPFFNGENDENGKKKAKETISKACSEYGFFLIVNHGVPQEFLSKAMQLSKTYFKYPDEEKLKCSPKFGVPLPAGYIKQPHNVPDKNEFIIMFPPDSSFNVLPSNPPEFKESLEKMFICFSKLGELMESIINECLGLPTNFLKEYNHDRSWDLMAAIHYFAAVGAEDIGQSEHEDGSCISFVVQDDVSGLEVQYNGEWIPVIPEEGKIVVNVADVIQVLTNNKFKSGMHRVASPKGRSRNSFAFFYNLPGEKWVEPLPQFTKEIGEEPKYRGFKNQDYQALRVRNKTHPPARPEDVIRITHYAIPTSGNQKFA
ncbi:unnamed protein product [Coffea canephora]|uniref:Fe2OG dioxygenase domain-containing protein n=1 Tax=Coffea canephora TaxID=49390 RepID=A0A068UXH5_COFCA|nr:unnamed protein product [Coffea canephora]